MYWLRERRSTDEGLRLLEKDAYTKKKYCRRIPSRGAQLLGRLFPIDHESGFFADNLNIFSFEWFSPQQILSQKFVRSMCRDAQLIHPE